MTFEAYLHGFGCTPDPTRYEDAPTVVIPVPLEWGTAEAPGVGTGPLAVLGASRFLETYVVARGLDPLERGVATLEALRLDYGDRGRPIQQVEAEVARVVGDGKRPLCLGGDRTLALGAARGTARAAGPIGVVLVSRRPGLLHRSDGREVAPATLARRLAESLPTHVLGARWWSREEAGAIASGVCPVIPARAVAKDPGKAVRAAAERLPRRVHLSVDVGVLDPATLPMAGNVEPGGLGWYELLDLVDAVFEAFDVASCDVSGFVPAMGEVGPSLTVAQLVLHCLAAAVPRP
jgi:agmatinase